MSIWVANILLVGGAVLISILPAFASSALIFAGFLVGHAFLSLHVFRVRERGLLAMNIAMAMLDLYAISIRL